MASDLSSGCTETIDILDDEKEEGEISLEDVSSSEEGGVGHLTSNYVISKKRSCTGCKSTWGECASWCTVTYHSKNHGKRDLKGKENRHHIKETGCAITKHTSTLQEKNDDLVPISSDSDMEIVGLTDTSNRSKAKIKKKKKQNYDILTSSIDDLISPASVDLPTDFATSKTHYRELNPIHKSVRSRVISKSPIRRYRSPMRIRSPVFRSSHSPSNYSKSPAIRRSPRRLRSPKQISPHRSMSTRTLSRKPSRPESSLTRSYNDRHGEVTRLLKKVKRLDSVGVHALKSNVSRSKKSSSLKHKIFNMLRKIPDNKDVTSQEVNMAHLKEKSKVKNDTINDADDEEDLALLRQKALETKQKKSTKLVDCPVNAESEKKQIAKDDDQDVEALQLRMIALHSAIMKKHQDRVQRGIRTKKKKSNRSESPFNQNFLDDIPVPGEELLKFASPPCTPPHTPQLADSNHTEDMELDTDVEREKEKLPYSPTDRIISEIPIDTALLGIEPSDVSFINVNETNSPVFDDEEKRNEQMPLSTSHSPYYNNIYSLHGYETYSSSQHDDRIFHSDLNNVQNHFRDYHNDNVECDLLDGICCQSETHSKDTIYEKSDAVCVLPTNNTLACNLSSDNPLQMEQTIEKSNDGVLLMNIPIFKDDKYSYEMQMNSEYSGVNSAKTFTESVPPNELIMIDDIAETEVQFTFPNDNKNLSAVNIPKKMTPCQMKTALEPNKEKPLYMQGVSDITDDLNKIPTLINRTLVPASILKSNKQLQQQLPKKHEIHPTFKSAEMQPVIVNTIAKSDSTFKPIKLQPSKKPTPILMTSVIFDNSNENSENDVLENRDNSLSSKNETTFIDNTLANDDISMRKKRKRIKKKRKSALFSFAQLLTEKDNSCNANDNTNEISISSESTECTESEQNNDENNDENKTQKCSVDNKESLNLQNVGLITQESLSDSNNIAENKDASKEDQNISLENEETTKQAILPIPSLQEKNTKSYSPTNIISNNIDSGTLNITETTKDNATNRRQSIDEDEDELRAILLASLAKRSKSVDTNGNSTMTVAANFITTNTQTTTQKTLADEPTNITLTINHNAPLESKLNSSETNKKKIPITVSTINNKKKISEIISHIPKKKRISIPASTKVVNNAKKYQNMIVQRKLNLRKLDNACNNVKPNEKWSNINTSKTMLAKTSDTQRFVINLGSDTDSESETEKCRPVISTTEKSQQDVNADFEKSLQKFLRDMRKEQEQSVAKPISTSQVPISSPAAKRDASSTDLNKGSSNMHTPLAVRHLPASQQEEYHRLKQQILEREKLKLQRKIADNNNSNKLLDKGVIGSPIKSICEKKNINVKQNQTTSREEGNSQKLSTQIGKKNIDVATNTSELNASPMSANKNHSANVAKHTNSTLANLQVKGIKKTIPNNLSIRITNEIAPKHVNKIAESSIEKQSVNDKQQHRPALRALSKEEINRKYVSTQVQLKSDAIGRVVTVNDKLLQHDVTNVNQSEKLIDNHDVNIEIMKESKNNENSNNSSTFSNISTTFPHDTSLNANKQELVNIMEITMSHSQYETECQEINCNTSVPLTLKDDDSNNISRKSDVDKDNTDSVWNVLKKNIRMEMDSLINLSKAEQQRYLRDTEHKLVAKRYIVLDHLAEMSGNFRQWDMEKDLQNSLAAEVKKLEEQLKMAEERLQSQRDRVNGMGPKISIARQKINAGRRECFKLSKICSTLGNQLMGKNYKLPEAGGQLLSDKLKEVTEHTRQFSKKKRTQSNDVPESFYSNSSEQIIDLSKITRAKENLLSQEQLRNDVADVVDVAGSKSNSSCLRQSNDNDNILILDDSFSLDNPEIFPNQITVKKKDILMNISESYGNEQIIVPNQSNLSIPKLNNNPIERNNEHVNKSHSTDISDPAMSSVPKSLATNIFLCKNDEQRNDKETSQPSTITTAYTTTTTMTTTAVVPYVSILTHLNTPRNTNPHGILCPYEIMGICRDEDCQFIHQSKSET